MKSLIVMSAAAVGGIPTLYVIAAIAEPILRELIMFIHQLGF